MGVSESYDPLIAGGEVVKELQHALSRGVSSLDVIPGLLKRVIRENFWHERHVPQVRSTAQFDTFAEFVTAHLPEGMGTTVETLERLCKDDDEVLGLIEQATQNARGNPTGRNQYTVGNVDNVHNSSPGRPSGNSDKAALRRLRKDAPKLHAEVIAGNLSPHGAMVQAGFRKKTISIKIDTDAVPSVAASIVRNGGKEFACALVSALAELIAEEVDGE